MGGSLKKGSACMIDHRPVKISSYITIQNGKHGAAKAHFFGIDLFNDKKYEEVKSTDMTVQVPYVTKEMFTVIDAEDDESTCTLMDQKGALVHTIRLPQEFLQGATDIRKRMVKSLDEENELKVTVIS